MAITVACTSTAPPVADTRDADVAAVKAVEVAWSKDARTKSPEAFAKYYAGDCTVMIPNAPAFHSRDETVKALKGLMSDPNFSMSFQNAAAEASKGGDMVYTQGSYAMTVPDPKGKPMKDKSKYLNSDLPMPAPGK